MNEALLKAVQQRAAANDQSVRLILEAAVRHYLASVTPSGTTLRPQFNALADEDIWRNDNLLKRLAKANRRRAFISPCPKGDRFNCACRGMRAARLRYATATGWGLPFSLAGEGVLRGRH
jgi:uncharacterized protein with von Willebrand factor type A (vWA) domain